MRKVIIAGATSMIGLSLVDECKRQGTKVFAIIRKDSLKRHLLPEGDFIKIIECDADRLADIEIEENDFDCFYSFVWAGTTGADRNNNDLQKENIRYTVEALKLAKRLNCKKFVGAGSQAEYGVKSEILTESTETEPVTEYGKAKLSACKECSKIAEELKIDFNWVRILSVYGVNDGKNTLVSSLIRKIKNKEKIELTACEQVWDYLYSDDAGKAFYLIGESGKNGRIYVLGSGISMPLKEYVEIIRNKIDKDANIVYGAIPYGQNQVMHLQADIDPLKEDTGWVPEISFEEGISKILQKVEL